MDVDDLAQAPTKRDVKTMTADLAEVSDADRVLATFATERAGIFQVRGDVKESLSGSHLVGGATLDQNRKPVSELRALSVGDASDDVPGDAVTPMDLQHGDVVWARFTHGFYGDFDISGVAVGAEDGERLTVGGWYLRTNDGESEYVAELRRLSAADEHVVPIPARAGLLALDA